MLIVYHCLIVIMIAHNEPSPSYANREEKHSEEITAHTLLGVVADGKQVTMVGRYRCKPKPNGDFTL